MPLSDTAALVPRARWPRCRVGMLVLLLGSVNGALAADSAMVLKVLTSHFPPYTLNSGQDAPGPLANMALAVMARAGHSGTVEFLPWPRVQLTAQRDAESLVIPLVRSSDRESKYQWVGRLACRNMVLVSLRARWLRLDEEALLRARLTRLRAAPHKAELKVKAVTEATTFDEMARMLTLGLVDVAYGSQDTLLLALRAQGQEADALVVSPPLETDAMWLAASPAMAPNVVEQLRQGYQVLQGNGSLKRMLEGAGLASANCP